MAPTRTDVPIKATRVDYRSSVSFDTAESRLRAEIQGNANFDFATGWRKLVQEAYASKDQREAFIAATNDTVGPHGFRHFFEVNHGIWLPIFDAPTVKARDGRNLKSIRFILGNPLIAIGMLKHDITAGLYAPTELFLIEEDEGTRISYQLPSGLVAGYEGASKELLEGAEHLDGKLEALIKFVLAE